MKCLFRCKRKSCLVVGCFWIAAASATIADAQNSPPRTSASPSGTLVAVVDLPKVFESHPNFKANIESIQQQVRATELRLENQKKRLAQRGRTLQDLSPASADYKRLESELARQSADLQVQARQSQKEFFQQEARQYYAVYQQVMSAIEKVASKYSIGLVLRYDNRPIEADTPQSVAHGMNRSVVLQRDLDITPYVVQELQFVVAATSPNGRTLRR